MLTNLKIGTRLALGFGIILALLVGVAGIGLNRMAVPSATQKYAATRPELTSAKQPIPTPRDNGDGQWESF